MKYLNVNWVNGMKISKDHFIQQDNAFDDKLRDAAGLFLNSMNYGLMPLWPGEQGGDFKVVLKVDNQKLLKVDLVQCRAVTPGGARIEILEDNRYPPFSIDLTKEIEALRAGETSDYYILLNVDLFNRVPVGELDASEEPPRYPHTKAGYRVSIFPASQVVKEGINPTSIFIGKLFLGQDKHEIADNYIPPCMSLRSHHELMAFYSITEKFFNHLELDLLSIIRKINDKNQDTSLATSVKFLSENLLQYISGQNIKLRWEIPDQAPVYLFEGIAGFARIMRNTIDSNASASKEELLNYFTNWSELKQGDFEKLLVYCINFEYDHNEILNNVEQFNEFIQIMTALFTKLESLAYIGKKKETSIFVKEDKAKRSFLAD